MKNYIQPGNSVTMTAPSGGVVSGIAYLIGALFGVAAVTAAEGESFEMSLVGVYTLPAASGASTDFTAGAKLYWDDTAKKVTKTATGNTPVGYALADKATGGTTATVRLTPGAHVADLITPDDAIADLAGLEGSANDALTGAEAITAPTITLSTSDTYSDAAVKTAVDAGLDDLAEAVDAEFAKVNTDLLDVQAKIGEILAALRATNVIAT